MRDIDGLWTAVGGNAVTRVFAGRRVSNVFFSLQIRSRPSSEVPTARAFQSALSQAQVVFDDVARTGGMSMSSSASASGRGGEAWPSSAAAQWLQQSFGGALAAASASPGALPAGSRQLMDALVGPWASQLLAGGDGAGGDRGDAPHRAHRESEHASGGGHARTSSLTSLTAVCSKRRTAALEPVPAYASASAYVPP